MRKARRIKRKESLIEYCYKCKRECTSDCIYLIKYNNYIKALYRRGDVYA